MARISDELMEEFRDIAKDKGIEFKSEFEARESAENLVRFFEILIKIDSEEKGRLARLKEEPKGFVMEASGRSCGLCRNSIHDQQMWYDKYGMKCMDCQEALDNKIIPGYVFKDLKNEKHVTDRELYFRTGLRSAAIRKLVRQGKLMARIIPKSGIHVFLRKENPNLKVIIEGELVETERKKSVKLKV